MKRKDLLKILNKTRRENGGMKPVVIVKGRKAEPNPEKNKLTIDFLFPNAYGKKGSSGVIHLINGDIPRIIVNAPGEVDVIGLKGGDADVNQNR